MRLITTPERFDKYTILQAFFKNVVHHKFMWSRAIVEDQIYFALTFTKESYVVQCMFILWGKNQIWAAQKASWLLVVGFCVNREKWLQYLVSAKLQCCWQLACHSQSGPDYREQQSDEDTLNKDSTAVIKTRCSQRGHTRSYTTLNTYCFS